MARTTVRRLFIAVLIALPVQYALVGVVGAWQSEPWPALVLPAFQAPDVDAEGAVTDVRPELHVVFANGEEARLPASSFLRMLSVSHQPTFMARQCRPATLSGSGATERCRHPAVRRWLHERLAPHFPDRTVRQLRVAWTRLRYRPARAELRSTALDTLTLTFDAR